MHTCISSHGLKRSWRSCPRRVNAGNKNTPSTHHPRRRNATTLMVGLKNGHIRKNLTQKWWTPEIWLGNEKKKKKKKKKTENFPVMVRNGSVQMLKFPVAAKGVSGLLLLVGCLTSRQHARVSQGRICFDSFTCCHIEIEVADQSFHLTQSQYTDTGPTSPSADPITPGAWQGGHWGVNFYVIGMTRPGKNPVASGIWSTDLPRLSVSQGRGMLRQFYVLLHRDRSCRSNFLPHLVTVYWHRADQSQCWPYSARRIAG